MDDLQRELDRLLDELAELDRCTEHRNKNAANSGLMTLAKRGTKLAIAEVREQMARSNPLASS
jgi:hypothetical protein